MLNTELLPAQFIFLQNPKKLKIEEAFSFIIRDLVIRQKEAITEESPIKASQSRDDRRPAAPKRPAESSYDEQDEETDAEDDDVDADDSETEA